MTELVFPDSLTEIDTQAFYGCDSLSKVTFGEQFSFVGLNAFYGCTNLTWVYMPEPEKWSVWYRDTTQQGYDSSRLSDPTMAATALKTSFVNCTWHKEMPPN